MIILIEYDNEVIYASEFILARLFCELNCKLAKIIWLKNIY